MIYSKFDKDVILERIVFPDGTILDENNKDNSRDGYYWSDEPPIFVPTILTPRQFRLALLATGKNLQEIEDFIKSLPIEIGITWEYSLQFERYDTNLNQFALVLGITQEQLDNIFIIGETL